MIKQCGKINKQLLSTSKVCVYSRTLVRKFSSAYLAVPITWKHSLDEMCVSSLRLLKAQRKSLDKGFDARIVI